jgi:hypothetical protein
MRERIRRRRGVIKGFPKWWGVVVKTLSVYDIEKKRRC